MADKWVKRWEVPGSNGKTWIVGLDREGNHGCSCPVWKFKRKTCEHIDQVKAGLFCPQEHREAVPGNVGQVQINGEKVLYPLVPFGNDDLAVDLRLTIVFDMLRAGVHPDQVKEYKNRMLSEKITYSEIMDHVRQHGRVVYSRFVTGRGWVDPVHVSADAPLKAVS